MARVKELEGELKAYQDSAPGAGSGSRVTPSDGKITLDSVTDRLNKLATL
jgi:hypothetical protein